ncbi:Arc family DNA-binding protein [Paracoccus sp. SM22M-07]|uniref:Arc family DNA-binding protein n=1 Tax=Paracoccus sp. SM22M-07 TaxID=1520813 RepID=UPI0009307CD2|nr:Arc family DNA-binding protein [Paracoccus sp. SM22M-07]
MSETQNRTLTEQFMVRLPAGMRDRIKAAAESNNRSMNSEIVATLEDAYPEGDGDIGPVVAAVIEDGQERRVFVGSHWFRVFKDGSSLLIRPVKK